MADREQRKFLCSESVILFMLYYMRHYARSAFADYHKVMGADVRFEGMMQFLLWICFRESAKTTLARAFVTQQIVYAKKYNISWVGHEEERGKMNLRAVVNELQGNKRIIDDFGQLYFDDSNTKGQVSLSKSVKRFTTANGVTVVSGSTQKSTRGALESQFRPDLYVLDDIENNKTRRSKAITLAIIEYLDELLTGMSADCSILILGNRISKVGVINHLEKMFAKMPERAKVFEKKLIENGKLTWPAAWVFTEKEEKEINATREPKDRVRSVEAKKLQLGERLFLQEYQNQPAANSDKFHEEDFNGYALSELEGKKRQLEVAVVIDPAFSTRTDSDNCVIAVIAKERWNTGVTTESGMEIKLNRYYLLDGQAETYLPAKSIQDALNFAIKWVAKGYSVRFISVETVDISKNQRDFVRELEIAKKNREINIPLRYSRPVGMGEKEMRIVDVCHPVLSSGRFFVRVDDPNNGFHEQVQEEFLAFPLADHDDCPDCIAQGIHEFEAEGTGELATQTLQDFPEHMKELHTPTAETLRPWEGGGVELKPRPVPVDPVAEYELNRLATQSPEFTRTPVSRQTEEYEDAY